MRLLLSFVLAGFVLSASSCGGGTEYVIQGNAQLVLLTNLRVDARGNATSLQAWRGTSVLPICTPVTVTLVRDREIRFQVTGTNRTNRYVLHRSTALPIEDHVNRYFGGACANVAAMSPADQSGIQQGRPMPGMTREGVILAVGYPPEHRTPSLDAPVWTYWGEAGEVQVQFDGNVVVNVAVPMPGQRRTVWPGVVVR